MEASAGPHHSRLSANRREGEQVTPLELFFDLVFVLAITQCTALMSHHPSWSGLAQGLLVLGVALISARRLVDAEPGRARNELARDSYSYIHFALVAGVVLVAFRYRHIHTLNRHRLGLAVLFA